MLANRVLLTLLLLSTISIRSVCQILPSNQDQINLHARTAQKYLREQRPDLAIPELQKLVALDPGNVDARGNLGVLLFFRADYKESIPQLSAAIKMKPELWRVQALLGLAEGRVGDNNSSSRDLEVAFPHLTEEKIQTEVGRALINDYTATGDLEKAATVASTLLVLQPTNSPLLYTAYRLYSDLAGKTMLTLALAAPDSAEMHQMMARELARHGDEAAAIANYREAIRIDPQFPGVHSELGDLLYYSSDTKLQVQAESEIKAALAVNPKDERAYLVLGKIAEKNGDIKVAYADYSHALELDQNDGDACTEVAKILVAMNQNDKAQQMFERAIQIDPSNYLAHYRLGTLYRQAGRSDDAKQQVTQYLEYKRMRDKLETIFHDMRVLSGQHASDHGQDEK
jgi:tetratricopeptide (TPR) repeat protein